MAVCVRLGMEGIRPVALRFTVCHLLYSDHTVDALSRLESFTTIRPGTESLLVWLHVGSKGREVEEPKNAAL